MKSCVCDHLKFALIKVPCNIAASQVFCCGLFFFRSAACLFLHLYFSFPYCLQLVSDAKNKNFLERITRYALDAIISSIRKYNKVKVTGGVLWLTTVIFALYRQLFFGIHLVSVA